jgi:hypothetical protein
MFDTRACPIGFREGSFGAGRTARKKPELKLGTKRRSFVPNFSSGFFLRCELLALNSKSL